MDLLCTVLLAAHIVGAVEVAPNQIQIEYLDDTIHTALVDKAQYEECETYD